jgi:hypothetical protein
LVVWCSIKKCLKMYAKQLQGFHGITIWSQSIDSHLQNNSCILGFDPFFPWVPSACKDGHNSCSRVHIKVFSICYHVWFLDWSSKSLWCSCMYESCVNIFELRATMHYKWWSTTIKKKCFHMVFNNSSLFMSMSKLF